MPLGVDEVLLVRPAEERVARLDQIEVAGAWCVYVGNQESARPSDFSLNSLHFAHLRRNSRDPYRGPSKNRTHIVFFLEHWVDPALIMTSST